MRTSGACYDRSFLEAFKVIIILSKKVFLKAVILFCVLCYAVRTVVYSLKSSWGLYGSPYALME